MTFTTFDAVFYALAVLVPGFICDSVLGVLVPRSRRSDDNPLLRYFTYSAFNYALWSWLMYLIAKEQYFADRPVVAASIWLTIILLSPIALALVIARLRESVLIVRVLSRLGLSVILPGPTAWDTFFHRTTPLWALVTLKDGRVVAGLFGSRSLAADDGTGDIYIEQVCRVGDPWVEVPGSGGVWIRGDEIKLIEFHERRP